MDLITEPYPSKFGSHRTLNSSTPFSYQGFLHQNNVNRSPSSIYSSIDSASPSSNHGLAFDQEDSGMDATQMSTCTTYYSMEDTNNTNYTTSTTTGFSSHHSSPQNTVNSFAQFAGNQGSGGPSFQNVFRRTYSNNSDADGTSSPFRSPSNSFGTSQRPRIPFINRSSQSPSTVPSTAGSSPQYNVRSPNFIPDEDATNLEYPSLQGVQTALSVSPPTVSSTPSFDCLTTSPSVSHDQGIRNSVQLNQVSRSVVGITGTSSSSSSLSCMPELRLLSQPSKNHRARYRTEGSRGAVKDRTGRSFPVVKLIGYSSPTPVKVRCFIGSDKNPGDAHLYYQVSKIVGKNITPCNVIKVEGVKMIEMDLLPDNGFGLIVNCVGIVKERNFDVQRKTNGGCGIKRKSGTGFSSVEEDHLTSPNLSVVTEMNENSKPSLERKQQQASTPLSKRSTTCNLVFTCSIPMGDQNGQMQTLQVVSESINCAQILGSPEIHKISQTRDFFHGGTEVFVIGKNFTRDAKIVWDFGPSSSPGGLSIVRESDPESDFMNQNHLIFKVPLLKSLLMNDLNANDTDQTNVLQELVNNHSNNNCPNNTVSIPVSLRMRCGEKLSDAILFTFIRVVNNSHVSSEDHKMILQSDQHSNRNDDGLNFVTSSFPTTSQLIPQQLNQTLSGQQVQAASKMSCYR